MATGSASEELLKHASEDPEHTVDHSLPKGVAAPAQEPDESLSSGLFAKGGMCVTTLLLASSGMGSGMIALPYAVCSSNSHSSD